MGLGKESAWNRIAGSDGFKYLAHLSYVVPALPAVLAWLGSAGVGSSSGQVSSGLAISRSENDEHGFQTPIIGCGIGRSHLPGQPRPLARATNLVEVPPQGGWACFLELAGKITSKTAFFKRPLAES